MSKLAYGKAICYSGYRTGQRPGGKYPSYEEIKEDMQILEKDYDYIRMYDPSQHAKTTLEVIRNEKINLKVMLGIDLLGENYNDQCQWGGKYSDEQIKKNISYNEKQVRELIKLANKYEDIIVAVSAGNEAVPEWNENLVTPERVLYFVKTLKENTNQLVTYCENVNYWIPMLKEVAETVDIISVHTYPAWINTPIEKASETSNQDYLRIKNHYAHKDVIITEAGWPTRSSGRGILPEAANEMNQKRYIQEMEKWSEDYQVLVFFFEAFDEPWKGANNPDEPEKHWGLYELDRTPKPVKQ